MNLATGAGPLPVEEIVTPLRQALAQAGVAVVVAPPGAGKTTRLPLALLDEPWLQGRRIVVLEPRRLAARAAAARMAAMLGEQAGETVGLRVRMESRVSARTRIEVVTEGVFTRMALDDPELAGVGCVMFDEFHERSLDADFGLALALEIRGALRDDLRLVVMSATLDGSRVAGLIGANHGGANHGGAGPAETVVPVLESAGRSFPVETHWVGRRPQLRLEDDVADVIMRALRAHHGSVLAFLPGQGEILRTQRALAERLAGAEGAGVDVVPLYGALAPAAQDRAVAPPAPGRRKVVLATSVAETSITIEGVRVVVDCGLSRAPRYEPAVGMTRLETVRASRAEADQRRGRAGRTQPGVCFRMWAQAAEAGMEPFAKPEILAADLAPLVLDCAAWGVSDPATLAFLDPPPAPALKEAAAFLEDIGALSPERRMTPLGQALSRMPLPPRLARMLLLASAIGEERRAALIAALLTERGAGGDSVDLQERLERIGRDRSPRGQALRRLAGGWAKLARRLAGQMQAAGAPAPALSDPSAGAVLALAYPDRIARARGRDGLYHMVNGRGVRLEAGGSFASAEFVCVAEAMGQAASARVLLAAALRPEEVLALGAGRMEERREVSFDRDALAVRVRVQRRLGALVLAGATAAPNAQDDCAGVLARGLASVGPGVLPWTRALRQWRERVMFMRRASGGGDRWPDLADDALAADTAWLEPCLAGKTALSQISPDELEAALQALLPWELRQELESGAPTHFDTPAGTRVAINYGVEDGPVLAVKVQELFGLAQHPALAGGRTPLTLHLLSPAQRPIQITRDLPGFWRGSWADVRAEMRGRYPKHFWPEDPASAPPTRRAGRPPSA